jgi:hypothetical protein
MANNRQSSRLIKTKAKKVTKNKKHFQQIAVVSAQMHLQNVIGSTSTAPRRTIGISRKSTSAHFPYAAPRNLRLPQVGNITAPEMVAFLPNHLRSHDIVFRLASNGVTNQHIATMANYLLHSDKENGIDKNSLCHIMQKAMRDYGYAFADEKGNEALRWTNTLHKEHDVKNWYGAWDEQNLSLAGLIPQCLYELGNKDAGDELINNVTFASLAHDIKRWPSIELGDGLDLTRCVQYAVAHSDEDLLFPRDFATLTKKLGGPLTVENKHYDHVVFGRWNKKKTPNPPATIIPVAVTQPAVAPQLNIAPTVTISSQTTVASNRVSRISQAGIIRPRKERVKAARAAIKAKNFAKLQLMTTQPTTDDLVDVDMNYQPFPGPPAGLANSLGSASQTGESQYYQPASLPYPLFGALLPPSPPSWYRPEEDDFEWSSLPAAAFSQGSVYSDNIQAHFLSNFELQDEADRIYQDMDFRMDVELGGVIDGCSSSSSYQRLVSAAPTWSHAAGNDYRTDPYPYLAQDNHHLNNHAPAISAHDQALQDVNADFDAARRAGFLLSAP